MSGYPEIESEYKTTDRISFLFLSWNQLQGCALAEPSGPWRLTFALGRLENLIFFHTNHMLGTLDFTVLQHWAPFNFP